MASRPIVDDVAVLSHIRFVMTEATVSVSIVGKVAALGHWYIISHAMVRGSAAIETAVPILIAIVRVIAIIVGRIIAAAEEAHVCPIRRVSIEGRRMVLSRA
jgi:uncharacterized membrane protein YidH (DUF202 family)